MRAASEWSAADAIRERYRRATGDPVERDVRPYFGVLAEMDALAVQHLGREAIATAVTALRERAAHDRSAVWMAEAFALTRELAGRVLGLRPFDVQVAAGAALAAGRVAQMATGEGKTLTAVAPAVFHALAGRRVHVFTANEYLAARDAAWMGPLYRALGITCSCVTEGMRPRDRREAYAAGVTYVTAREAGFDYLRDHTAMSADDLVHSSHDVAIVDEADCILVDEARIPLVIAAPAPRPAFDPRRLAHVARTLQRGTDYTADDYGRTVIMTDAGFSHASALLGVAVDSAGEHLLLSAVHVALHAEALLRRDRDYVVRHDRVEIVDEWTGRVAENRRWPNGIQTAVEAKEGVTLTPEGRIAGSVPMQHFVRQYAHLAGMTATAETAAQELQSFFGLTTVVFPPHRPCARIDEADVVFAGRRAKHAAILDEIARVHATARPILVGTATVAESDALAFALRERGVACAVLNARQDAEEAAIIARAGRLGAVTISTNMAGRGTDIVLGRDAAEHDAVVRSGGLYVIGTNRHESRRIDDQLRGRAGRQGDPGSSRFFISLEDDLVERYGVLALIPAAHRPPPGPEPVQDPVASREIERAQRIVEGQNFEIRRTLWKYSALVDEQRRIVAAWRQGLLAEDAEPDICSASCPEHYARLVTAAGGAAVRRAESALVRHVLDNRWSEHLGYIEDVREGIHLVRYGGREPIMEFHQRIVAAFDELIAGVDDDVSERFLRVRSIDGALDLSGAGLAGTSSTWTYLVNDNPFSTASLSLLANRNVAVAGAAGVIALLHLPLTLVATLSVLVRRVLARRRGRS